MLVFVSIAYCLSLCFSLIIEDHLFVSYHPASSLSLPNFAVSFLVMLLKFQYIFTLWSFLFYRLKFCLDPYQSAASSYQNCSLFGILKHLLLLPFCYYLNCFYYLLNFFGPKYCFSIIFPGLFIILVQDQISFEVLYCLHENPIWTFLRKFWNSPYITIYKHN